MKCPHCQKPFRVSISLKVAVPLLLLVAVLTRLSNSTVYDLGPSGGLVVGLATGLAIMLSMRLKPA